MMLSFLRESGTQSPPAQEMKNNSPAEGGIKNEQLDQPVSFAIAKKQKEAIQSTALLICLFAIVLMCLFLMIVQNAPKQVAASSAPTQEDLQLERAITRLTEVKSEISAGPDEIVKKFYDLSSIDQVHTRDLAVNPFRAGKFYTGYRRQITDDSNINHKNLELLTIMESGRGNLCMINDKILYAGDSIGDFKIIQIEDTFVKLQSGDNEIILKISE